MRNRFNFLKNLQELNLNFINKYIDEENSLNEKIAIIEKRKLELYQDCLMKIQKKYTDEEIKMAMEK